MSAHLEFLEGSAAHRRRWLIAGIFMLSMHVAFGALAFYSWPEEETSDEAEGAYLMELAAVAVAPPTDDLKLAIGQTAIDTPASVAPTEEVKEKSEIEVPTVAESPLAPDPEVVVEKKVPIEEVDDKEEKEDPRPELKAVNSTVSELQVAAAPPPIDAPVAEKHAAPRQGLSTKPSQAALSWQKSLAMHLDKHKKYPADAKSKGQEGVATVSFVLDRSGKVISAHLDKSSGSSLLDEEAIEVFTRASPFPTPPTDQQELTFSFSQPIQFRIKR
jgi:protein TonB